MVVTIIEGGELNLTMARISRKFNHRVNIIRQESEYSKKFEQIGIDIAFSSAFTALNPISSDKEKQ